MPSIIERAYRSVVLAYKKREEAITTTFAIGSVLMISGLCIQAHRDPKLYRELFVLSGNRALEADFELTGGINLRAVPGTTAYLVTLRESAQLATGDQLSEAMRRKVVLASGCQPSFPVQINPDADAKGLVVPGRETRPLYLLTVNCS